MRLVTSRSGTIGTSFSREESVAATAAEPREEKEEELAEQLMQMGCCASKSEAAPNDGDKAKKSSGEGSSSAPNKSVQYETNGAPKQGTVNFGYPNTFKSHYTVGKELGKGQFGVVHQCQRKQDGEEAKVLAVKMIDKSKFDSRQAVEDVRREVLIMKQLRNMENVVEIQDAFEDKKYVYIVMELCEGGELFDRIIKKGKYTEKDAAVLVRQMLKVIAECHLQGIIHR